MAKELILTCDGGTTGCKCTIFNRAGTALCSVRREYQTIYPKPNWAEQSADVVVEAVYAGIRELLEQVNPDDIACIGLSGTMNGLIAVDETGKPLYNNIIHSDSRAWRETEKIAKTIPPEEFYKLTGNRLDHHFTLPKILWLRENMPDIYRRSKWWLNTKDYLYGHLTGQFGYTDYSDASLVTALDIAKKVWAEDMLTDLGVDVGKMPVLRKGYDVSGRVSREAAKQTGLKAGTPVAIGGGDGACAGRGAGLNGPGSAYCYIGSSAWVSQLIDEPILDPKRRVFYMLDIDGESYYVIGVIQCGAAAYDWALSNLILDEEKGAGSRSAEYSRIENMARQIAPGSEGVLFLPTLMSERTPYWDANTRGCLLGFSLYHDRRHIARAVYEGVALALNNVVEIIRELGQDVNSMMLTGGGARSGLWPDILASVFGVESRVHQSPGESTSLGAAIAAGVGVGLYADFAEASKIVRERSIHPANPAWADQYRRVFEVYAKMYEQLKPLFDGIAGIP